MRAFVLSSQLHRLACIRIVRVSFGQVVEDVKAMPVGYAFVDYIKHTVSCDLLQGHTVSCALCDRAYGPCLLCDRACWPCLLLAVPVCRAWLALGLGFARFIAVPVGGLVWPWAWAVSQFFLALCSGCVPVFYGFYYYLFAAVAQSGYCQDPV